MPTEVYVALVTGICGCVGLLITAVFQVIAAGKKRKSDADDAQNKELEEAKKKLAEKEQKERDETIQRQISDIAEQGKNTQNEIKMLASQVEKMRNHANIRASESEDGIRMITTILSKDARTRSNLIHMYARTESQLKTLMEIETYNLRFTKDTATTLTTVGELLAKLLDSSEDAARLRRSLDENKEMQDEFMDGVINAQKTLFDQTGMQAETEIEAELEKINKIAQPKRKDLDHDA